MSSLSQCPNRAERKPDSNARRLPAQYHLHGRAQNDGTGDARGKATDKPSLKLKVEIENCRHSVLINPTPSYARESGAA